MDKDRADFYREHYKESLSNFRFFGQLRAQIAWAPPTIAIGAIGLLWDKVDPARISPGKHWVVGAILAILLMVFIANVYLQQRQARCERICRAAEAEWKAVLLDQERELLSYEELDSLKAHQRIKLWGLDQPSLLLLLFFSLLAGLVLMFASSAGSKRATCVYDDTGSSRIFTCVTTS